MIGRVVVTSVPRGLDGGAGFQTVLRTHGLSPAIAERLTIRASYSHPYGLGDARNPHVIFHRIETLAGKTIHVLGSVRDVGTSYTGRSNHLAELIAVDAAETGSLPGGPAFAARSFPWLSRWTGDPREVPRSEESTIPANDSLDPEFTGRPSRCVAWERATGDAGWAGELAQSFLDGRRALLWAGHDVDILELFAEAARLLPASVRWPLTFNTCEIEPFPAHWRAVRPELGLVGKYEPKNELRLVIAKIRENRSRPEHDHALVRRARGELDVAKPASGSGTHTGGPPTSESQLRAELERIRRKRVGNTQDSDTRFDHVQHLGRRWPTVVAWASVAMAIGAILLSAVAATWVASNDPGFFARLFPSAQRQIASVNLSDDLKENFNKSNPAAEGASKSPLTPEQPTLTPSVPEPDPLPRDESPDPKPDPPEAARKKKQMIEAAATAFNEMLARSADPKAISLLNDHQLFSLVSNPKPVDLLIFPTVMESVPLADVLDVLNITIEVIGPYGKPLKVERLDDGSASRIRSWQILGDRAGGLLNQEDQHVCTIHVTDGKLTLEPEVPATDALFKQLQNSLVLISTRDPISGSPPIVRRTVQLTEPLLASDIKEKELLLDTLKCDEKRFDDKLADRTEPFVQSLRWDIKIRHPSWGDVEKELSQDNATLAFTFPPDASNAIEVTYLDSVSQPPAWTTGNRDAKLTIAGEIVFQPKSLSAETRQTDPGVSRGKKTDLVKGLESVPAIDLQLFKLLLLGEEKGKEDLANKLMNRLNDETHFTIMFNDFLRRTDDLQKYNACLAEIKKNNQLIIGLGNVNQHETRDNRTYSVTEKKAALRKFNDAIKIEQDNIHTLINKFREDYAARVTGRMVNASKKPVGGEVSAIINSFEQADKRWVEPFVIRLRELWAVAKDARGNEYKIQIVKPDDDWKAGP